MNAINKIATQAINTPATGQKSINKLESILLAEPRGFCAGVDRAIDIVDIALQKFGAPIYVRHEIVPHIDGTKYPVCWQFQP